MERALESRSGRLYFGGNNGFNEFFPDSVKEKPYSPPIVLTDFKVFNKSVQIGDRTSGEPILKADITESREITLPYDQSVISFDFASLNYISPEKKEYQYRMEGFDKNWNNVGTRHTATYTNLDPGEYTFSVRGLDSNGEWSNNARSLQLNIIPPFWQTWWFRGLSIFLIMGGALSAYLVRMRRIHVNGRSSSDWYRNEPKSRPAEGQLAYSIGILAECE